MSDKRNPEKGNGYSKSYQAQQTESEYVCCEKLDHGSDCKTAKTVTEHRKILSDKKLCFNCTGAKHRAAECRSAKTCLKCKSKHLASICDKLADSKSEPMLLTTEANVTYPIAIIKVNGVKCRGLSGSGSGSSYISESFTDLLKINPVRKEYKTIETLTNFTTKKLKIYNLKVENLDENFSFQTELNKLEREVLITLPNPKYNEMIETYDHLKGIKMNERDTKPELPIHAILGASDYVKIKMQKCPRVRKINEPIAEQTKMGRVIMLPGRESDLVSSLYTRASVNDFNCLCHIDVLGMEENHLSHDENVYKKFKQQLERSEGGWYETGLVSTENKVPLNNNKSGSLGPLKSLLKQLEQNPEIFKAYDLVIRDQLVNKVKEKLQKIKVKIQKNSSCHIDQ